MSDALTKEASRVRPRRKPEPGRRQAMARAALAILGEQGSRGLTHRAIDKHLGLPEGSTSAYFRRREDLVGAAVKELFRSDAEMFETGMGRLLDSGEPLTLDSVVEFFVGMINQVRHNSSDHAKLARYECFLLARRDPDANRQLMALFDDRQKLDTRIFVELGARNPEKSAIRLGFALRGAFFSLAFLTEPAERLDELNADYLRSEVLAALAE